MWYGVRLLCDDNKERSCVPVLCQYIADFEEQTLCGGLYGHSCPKCTAWSARLETHRPSQVNYSSVNNGCPQRLDSDAGEIQRQIPRRRAVHLSTESTRIQYTPIVLFSVDYPYGGILDTCCADLLHQVSECSWDCTVKKWLRPILTDTTSNTKKMKNEDILWKLTSNFRLSRDYPALKCFNSGVFTQKHMWTMREFKMTMQQNPGTNR
jgi:hypothetical protein